MHMAIVVVTKMDNERRTIILPNVPSDRSLLAFGIRAYSAGEMPKVLKGQGFGRLVCSHSFLRS